MRYLLVITALAFSTPALQADTILVQGKMGNSCQSLHVVGVYQSGSQVYIQVTIEVTAGGCYQVILPVSMTLDLDLPSLVTLVTYAAPPAGATMLYDSDLNKLADYQPNPLNPYAYSLEFGRFVDMTRYPWVRMDGEWVRVTPPTIVDQVFGEPIPISEAGLRRYGRWVYRQSSGWGMQIGEAVPDVGVGPGSDFYCGMVGVIAVDDVQDPSMIGVRRRRPGP